MISAPASPDVAPPLLAPLPRPPALGTAEMPVAVATVPIPVDYYATYSPAAHAAVSLTPAARLRELKAAATRGGDRPQPGSGSRLVHYAVADGLSTATLRALLDRTATRTAGDRAPQPAAKSTPIARGRPHSINDRDLNGRTSLHYAAAVRHGHIAQPRHYEHPILRLQRLSDREVGHGRPPLLLNSRDNCGRTALHYAALTGNARAISQLAVHPRHYAATQIPEPLDLGARDRTDITPLHLAAYSGSVPALRELIRSIEKLVQQPKSQSPAHLRFAPKTLSAALAAQDYLENSVLHYAVASGRPQMVNEIAGRAPELVSTDVLALADAVKSADIRQILQRRLDRETPERRQSV